MTTKRYSLSFTYDQLLHIASCVEGCHTHYLTEDELDTHDKLLERLFRSVGRANDDQA